MIVWVALAIFWRRSKPWFAKANLSVLPERFVVLDLETTGLDAGKQEIIEFGAIRVNRDSTNHETFQSLVKPSMKVPKQITELTGITQEMIEAEGEGAAGVLRLRRRPAACRLQRRVRHGIHPGSRAAALDPGGQQRVLRVADGAARVA